MPLLAVFAVLGALAAPQPTVAWRGSGWYQTEATASDYRIVSGPFASKALCVADMPPDTDIADFRCYDMTVKPRWEK
jgi:hypothetical protein